MRLAQLRPKGNPDDDEWNFGQFLSLILLAAPLMLILEPLLIFCLGKSVNWPFYLKATDRQAARRSKKHEDPAKGDDLSNGQQGQASFTHDDSLAVNSSFSQLILCRYSLSL
jgi:hypothetical protein